MMHDLEEIMLGVFEHNVDALVLQDDFYRMDDVRMSEFRAESHLPDSRLRDTRIPNLALLVRLEPVQRQYTTY